MLIFAIEVVLVLAILKGCILPEFEPECEEIGLAECSGMIYKRMNKDFKKGNEQDWKLFHSNALAYNSSSKFFNMAFNDGA